MSVRSLSVRSLLAVALLVCAPRASQATQFASGSIIIPMDIDYQDEGMLRAYGLLYQLLQANVPVHWVIEAGKVVGDTDLTTTAQDFFSGDPIASHGYRGGPFVIEPQHAAIASPIITGWQATYPETVVHVAQQAFVGRTGRLLSAAPTIAVIADDNEDIAFKYLNAAGIPDSAGQSWPSGKLGDYSTFPDILTTDEIAGPTELAHDDGALFRPSGQPAFCQIMTMHWDVKKVVDEVVAEYRSFLQFPTHMMAECQAVNAIENNVYGHFITPNGFLIDNNIKDEGPFEFLNADAPFGQMDGPYELVGGSERAYSLPAGDQFFDQHVVMIKDASTNLGVRSVWMTGYVDGKCSVVEPGGDVIGGAPPCVAGVGKISYLGGHKYEVKLPISKNAQTQGTRLFLNSLFEASCTTSEGQPSVSLTKAGPPVTTNDTVTYTLSYANAGPGPALGVTIADTLPPGASFSTCTGGCAAAGDKVTWTLGDLGAGATGSVQLVLTLAQPGSYQNQARATFTIGVNTKNVDSNVVTTVYQLSPVTDGGTPVTDGGTPVTDGGTPVTDGGTPVTDGGTPVTDGGTPVTDGGTPVTDGSTPGTDGSTPVIDGSTPVIDGGTPETDGGTPGTDGSIPGPDGGSSAGDGAGADGTPDDGGNVGEGGTPGGSASEGCDCNLEQPAGQRGAVLWLVLLATAGLATRRRRRAGRRKTADR